jgi:methyl-accepting chemotaxis protein
MAQDQNLPESKASEEDDVLQQQYLRSLSSFEGIVLSQIEMKNMLADRLNYSIRTGIIILGVIAFSILVLLFTLTSQVNRITNVVGKMNNHFYSISLRMDMIRDHMISMEQQVALLENVSSRVGLINKEMLLVNKDMDVMTATVSGIRSNLSLVREKVGNIAINMDQMNKEVQSMTYEMHRMGKPARTMNKMMPFP